MCSEYTYTLVRWGRLLGKNLHENAPWVNVLSVNPRVSIQVQTSQLSKAALQNMELILYPMLGTRSQRAILRERGKWGHNYSYAPRGDLLQRLSKQTGMSIEECALQLYKERQYLLNQNL